MKPTFFARPGGFRTWLRKYHKLRKELLVGFYKRDSGKPGISWPESVDEALYYGWIDGIRKSIDEVSYSIRFTPRRPDSHSSAINIGRVKVLAQLGLMKEAGMEAFAKRTKGKSERASYEQKSVSLGKSFEQRIRANEKAWSYFQERPQYYRRQCAWWITSAKKEETRQRRLTTLIDSSEKGELIPPFRWTKK